MAPSPIAQDRLIRKEVALGAIRERAWPEDHIGLASIAPFQDVSSPNAIFQFVQPEASGLVPARAFDAEAEMADKEDTFGEGRVSLVDWAIKDHYTSSDVQNYVDTIYAAGRMPTALPLSIDYVRTDFEARVARDTALRRKKIDNRLEWLIQQALWTGGIQVNDTKTIFNIDYGRPSGQTNASTTPWDHADSDPIGDLITLQTFMYDTYGIRLDRAITSRRVLISLLYSDKFRALSGFTGPAAANSNNQTDPFYQPGGWTVDRVVNIVEAATGIKFDAPYDAVYFTRAVGDKKRAMHRFSPEDKVCFLPSQASIEQLDDAIGFAKTLTAPHPAGNWTPGYYEWEKDHGQDPWGHDFGSGITALPVFPHMEMSYVLKVLQLPNGFGQIGGKSVGADPGTID